MDSMIAGLFIGIAVTILVAGGISAFLFGQWLKISRNTPNFKPFGKNLSSYVDPRKSGLFPPVTFTIAAQKAKSVYLVGSFNEWLRAASPGQRITPDPGFQLQPKGDGVWEITLDVLMPGSVYEYVFAIDYGTGYFQWTCDPQVGERGGWGSLVRISINERETLKNPAIR
jgi:hypothetical protein